MEWTRLAGLPESLNSFFRKHFSDIGDEKTLNKSSTASQPSSSSLLLDNSKICSKSEQTALLVGHTDGSTYKGCEKEPFANFTMCKGRTSSRKSNTRKKELSSKATELTEAEKKRLYRQKIKDTNPELWQEIKQRDAAQKRQKRAQRQMVAREMQMQLELEPSHSQSVQSLYLDALKERYPDLWEQLLHTVPEVRNRIDHKSRGAKSVAAYKDIIEAEKKRLYREKIKREKPEMWERQKARDAQRRNSQRLIKNTKQFNNGETVKTEKLETDSSSGHKKFSYLHNLEVNPDLFASSQNSASNLTPLQSVSSTEMDYNNSHMNSFTSRKFMQNHPCGMTGSSDTTYTKDSIKMEDNPSSTQSKILWFWNDTPEFSKISKFIPNNQNNADMNQELKHPSVNAIKCERIDELDNKSSCKRVSKSKYGKE